VSDVYLAWLAGAIVLFVAALALVRDDHNTTVHITEKGYISDRIELRVGEKVVFRNISQKGYTVTSKNPVDGSAQNKHQPALDSGIIEPATSWEHKFLEEGIYTYYCKEDTSMTGTIVVISAK